MADKITTTQSIQMMAEFIDGDTRTISIDYPNTSLNLGNKIYELQTFLQNNSVIIGDKNGAAFSRFSYANTVTKTRVDLDLGLN